MSFIMLSIISYGLAARCGLLGRWTTLPCRQAAAPARFDAQESEPGDPAMIIRRTERVHVVCLLAAAAS
jgi:hypothetical protein